jgi:hypothetical protein
VRLPADILQTDAITAVLQDYCGVLHAEGAFAGLSWDDAKTIAATRLQVVNYFELREVAAGSAVTLV